MPASQTQPTTALPLLDETTNRHRRLLRTLAESVWLTWHTKDTGRHPVITWEQRVRPLTDLARFDPNEWFVEVRIVDGDLEGTMQRMIAAIGEAMTGEEPRCPYDHALAHRGRILAVVRTSPDDPFFTRLDDGPTTFDGAIRCDDAPRRSVWVSTPETREAAARAFLEESSRLPPWIGSVAALIDEPEHQSKWILPAQDFPGSPYEPAPPADLEAGLEAALQRAILVACEAMLAPGPGRAPLDPSLPNGLTQDVALASAGRIHAVVQNAPQGPVVYRFRDLWPAMI